MIKNNLKIISASRRIDMVANDPFNLAQILAQKTPPEKVHTLVLWSKNPKNMFHNKQLYSQLKKYDQLFLHLSITGLGGSLLEPNVPSPDKVLKLLDDIINFLKNPQRICIRFDPIVDFYVSNSKRISNISFFKDLAPILDYYNLRSVTTSWVQIYDKIEKRLKQKKIEKIPKSNETLKEEADWLINVSRKYKLLLHGCCVPGWPISQCINGKLFNKLHPKGFFVAEEKAKGQRALCGCTKSWDIGWYHKCNHGCLYCYANPNIN